MDFAPCIAFTLKEEGGFVNNPKDPGGATNMGMTLREVCAIERRNVTVAELRTLTPAIVTPWYATRYFNAVHGQALPAGIDLMEFDFAVMSGPENAAKLLQQAVGAEADGWIGPATLAAVGAAQPRALIDKLSLSQVAYLKSCADWPTFQRGWMNRQARRVAAAHAMAAAPPPPSPAALQQAA